MPWVIGAYCCAFAYATELSLSALSATAALIGAAMFAFTSDIAARSGRASAVWLSSSSSARPWVFSYVIVLLLSSVGRWSSAGRGRRRLHHQPLRDRGLLLRVRRRDRAVRENIGGHGCVDRQREVRVHERHRRPLGQCLDPLSLELDGVEAGVRLQFVAEHGGSPP